ncbi:SMI1/KNR4 family protein [Haloferula sargassicola]|uniref:Knr4/Smi1-like domain-containing protein n=1 Tax=Haloferula sargassicola TaxID=490096 RepID=A0ABP9UY88_9BACT
MSKWLKGITAFHRLDHADDPDSLVLGEPLSGNAIAELEKVIGFTMPEEFKQFYCEHDGFGTIRGGQTDWFFLPLAKIPQHAIEVRAWFEGTHPNIARQFVPFIDWGNGDASGYILSDAGDPDAAIFHFEHESYEFEKSQDWHDFLRPFSSSVLTFFPE